jgi:phage repressor protein C with HTH and peptisase S24 domain
VSAPNVITLLKIVDGAPRPGVVTKRLQPFAIIGDSMEPTFRSRDLVVVDTCDTTPSPPGLFVIWDGLGLVAKRVEIVAGRARVTADNRT